MKGLSGGSVTLSNNAMGHIVVIFTMTKLTEDGGSDMLTSTVGRKLLRLRSQL